MVCFPCFVYVSDPRPDTCGLQVHDFTHRLHMQIFKQQYYPAKLVDWWMDDWITFVYGRNRT